MTLRIPAQGAKKMIDVLPHANRPMAPHADFKALRTFYSFAYTDLEAAIERSMVDSPEGK